MRKLRKDTVAKNVRRVIDDIGGRSATAAIFGIRPWAVSKWYDGGVIPRKRIKEVCRHANTARQVRGEEAKWVPELLLED